ncbi:hypothetical protein [Calothrix sp. CCY 0018]
MIKYEAASNPTYDFIHKCMLGISDKIKTPMLGYDAIGHQLVNHF